MNSCISRLSQYDGEFVNKNNFDSGVYDFVVDKICAENLYKPFIVFNIEDVFEKHQIWQQNLPRVRPFYTIKSNNNQVLLEILAKLKVGFVCVCGVSYHM